jgi:DNA-directed RNA polymerase delta subunit
VEEIKDPPNKLGQGAFLGLTIVDAAKKLLAHERRSMSNSEIAEAFKRGGLALNSADVLNTIGSVMNRRFLKEGDVVRVGRGTWGLKEWYPNRSFKAAPKMGAATAAHDTDELIRTMLDDERANARDEPEDESGL